MKAYTKPFISSYNISTHKLIASSQPIETPDIPTNVGGFYECNNKGCRPNDYQWANNNDSRNKYINGTKYQYIGCYEYKSNGSNVECEFFHTQDICEGKRYDLFISSTGGYHVEVCKDDKKHDTGNWNDWNDWFPF